MSHQTFYRKYRSRNFKEMVGQEHIIQTLENAIKFDRLSHAYIFSGPRGTGKTSTARIFAKTLNCRNENKPCLACDICQHITQGQSVDIIEIDAASNTGVDHMRDLKDTVHFAPVECQTKMYIIDEAHMLSTGAFNALLKTLEEPPSHTIFVLATTEPHKLPITIHSRCQQLHFRNLNLKEIEAHLSHVAEKEGITLSPQACRLLAKNAGGCMRDALSLLDQAYSFKGETIDFDDVVLILGATDDSHLIQLITYTLTNEDKALVSKLQELANAGIHIAQLVNDLLEVLKQMTFIQLNLTDDVSLDGDTLETLKSLCQKTTTAKIQQVMEVLAKTEMDLKWFAKPALLLQIRLLSCITTAPAAVTEIAVTSTTNPTKPTVISTPSPIVSAPTPATPTPTPTTPAPVIPANTVRQSHQATEAAKIHPPTGTTSEPSSNWSQVISKLKADKSPLYTILRGSCVEAETDDTLYIRLNQDFKFFREKLEEDSNKNIIKDSIKTCYNKSLNFSLDKPKETQEKVVQPLQKTERKNEDETTKKINQIVEMFEGSIV